MKLSISVSFTLLLLLLLHRISSEGLIEALANTPPRGWNSYDSFSWIISEDEFLQNAQLVSQRLRSHGYEYVVIDYLWYRKKVPGAYTDSSGFDVIDNWGRVIPDPGRWPSSKGGKGFTEVANKVHSMGLKFGFHIMRGISTQAVNANTPILDTTTGKAYVEGGKTWTASDIAIKERACAWMPHGFMSVNTKLGAGRAFLRSLHEQYASWGVDFIKHDCIFGEDLDFDEINIVSKVLRNVSRPVLYSLSPGTSVTPALAKLVSPLVNMYRITGDDWDNWGDVAAHFGVSSALAAANLTGSTSVMGKSWPDLDMLPLGWLTDAGSNDGPHRNSNLTFEEQKTQMTLWAMAKSPLMFGGDMRKLDDRTYNLLTNPTILEINTYSSKNKEFPFVTASNALKTNSHHCRSSRVRRKTKDCRSHKNALTLTSCKETNAAGWSTENFDEDLDRVCWKNTKKHAEPFCLYKRKARVTPNEVGDNTLYLGKTQLLTTTKSDACLGASSKRRLTSKELKRGSLSTCNNDANQMWELDNNGNLMNNYSGLCATVQSLEATAVPVGARAWVATGRKGEVYLAFFNLNQAKTTISAPISELRRAFPGLISGVLHKCTEVWTGQACKTDGQRIFMDVEAHGTALLVLIAN
ncbi:hypothetical protein RND81_02G245300 [Saponaria officinalis]|uniref:Alpha-galactosidase n=1 Tax=Saponaria officinalis TaxID=3572 RepID=A0AAW1MXZ1_SAPOF